jgi:predicted permease
VVTSILLDILAPILALVLLGALVRRKFHIDVGSLSKLNIYLFTPAFMFYQVSHSTLSWASMGGVVLVTVTQMALLGTIVVLSGKALRIGTQTLAAIALATMFYNSGNFGLPLAALAFPTDAQDGAAVQTFVALTQNFLAYTLGMGIAAWAGSGEGWRGISKVFRTPAIPAIACALLARWYLKADEARHLPVVIEKTTRYLSDGLVPIALVTLGTQLADNPRWPRWRPVTMVMLLRLVAAPVMMGAMLCGLHHLGWKPLDLWPWPAASLILTAGVPSAVVTLLFTLEVGGDADLAADCVFWTTVASALTLTGWLVALKWAFG